jgi:peptidoglycan/xylan/chitin deacetylase (PgdA/CDA1 family)
VNPRVKQVAIALAAGSGYFALRRRSTRSAFRVVTYHGVDERHDPVVNFDALQTNPAAFRKQLEELARAFRVMDLGEAVRRFLADGRWPERGLAITFDDGYRNNLDVAAPILRELGLPATFFVTAGFIEGRVKPWWYALRERIARAKDLSESEKICEAVKLEAELRPFAEATRNRALNDLEAHYPSHPDDETVYPFMTREDCRTLLAQDFDVQCHGDTHASFSGEKPERVKEEIARSANFIHALGHQPALLAYPYGHEPVDRDAARGVMQETGIIAAVTTREGLNTPAANPHSLHRYDLHGNYTAAASLARLSR